ncbi:Uncharacterised protein [BD1-7 clade bacterium]|uniref:EF-hand domain-containing protein n=1 Tax=BD1-7 clade bacterium TaxID=2029982 RepID=A0A5S9Q6D8_9GAMM|nr:Uncharacterised protein [BD1-7 clade bacterium]CAA0113968.1 Uncharacterised protein [BD1-7 clade bacterium]
MKMTPRSRGLARFTALGATATTLLQSLSAQAEDKIGLHYLHYQEGDDRITVGDTVLSFETDLGVDHTLAGSVGYDSISGASPAWQTTTPIESAEDLANRIRRVEQAQAATPEIILFYEPDYRNYAVEKVELEDTRTSADVAWTSRDKKRNELTVGINYSEESDYVSAGGNVQYLLYADDSKNRSYRYGAAFLYNVSDVFTTLYRDVDKENLYIGNFEIGVNQVLSPNSFMSVNAFFNYEHGYLSNHYLTILRQYDANADGEIGPEEVFLATDTRPDERVGGGIAANFVQSFGDSVAAQFSYRFYADDWDIHSHSVDTELSWQVTAPLLLYAKYRWYTQTGAWFFKDADASDNQFAIVGPGSADERLGAFNAYTAELGTQIYCGYGLYVDFGGAWYEQSNGFNSVSLMGGFTKKF